MTFPGSADTAAQAARPASSPPALPTPQARGWSPDTHSRSLPEKGICFVHEEQEAARAGPREAGRARPRRNPKLCTAPTGTQTLAIDGGV